MAFSPLSLLLRRVKNLPLPSPPTPLLLRPRPRPFSSSSPVRLPDPPDASDPSKPPSLSARLSFVFDQIDALDRRRRDLSARDDALHRIRSWRRPNPPLPDENNDVVEAKRTKDEAEDEEVEVAGNGGNEEDETMRDVLRKEVELVHPWPEWIELMERLAQQKYFDLRRDSGGGDDEALVAANVPIDLSEVKDEVGFDFSRDWTTVRNACMNFGRDRFDILKSLSRKDLQLLVGHGCPSTDPKVVFSAKLLRKLVHLDEGDVCSSCSLRNSCSRGYILTRKEDEARTLDVMRVLLTFGFDHINGAVENKLLTKMKSVKTVVRKLIHEIVKLSAVPIDPNLPPPVIKKPPPKVKQPPPPPRKRVGRDDVEMKKGDWLCPKCDFMNFAKNTVCLQCDAKRPKRQLLPGEWECPRCNFLNYRRNMACFHCEHKRPPDEYTENQMEERQSGPRMRREGTRRVSDVSNAWNFDFDDNESDGADVAAFEFADSHKVTDNSSANTKSYRGIAGEFEDEEGSRNFSKTDERKPNSRSQRQGFDDFDDEDDDIDNYELDMSKNNESGGVSMKNFSELEMTSDSEDFADFGRTRNSKKSAIEDYVTESDADDRANHPYWRSSERADSRQRSGGRTKDLISDSDDDTDEDFRSKRGIELESDDDYHSDTTRFKSRGRNSGSDTTRFKSRGRNSGSTGLSRSNKSANKSSFTNRGDDWTARDSRRYDRGARGDGYNGLRGNRGSKFSPRDKRGPRRDEYGGQRNNRDEFKNRQSERNNYFTDRSSSLDYDDDRPRRRIIER
ncbi:uncharacterized protein LOC109719632 [Ananas comosus]|uniref:Uncharacterized protein LOC109719632 n=1 Tax=Ananas comosus TaxID=4615 RepID=A0A6P5G9P4_ANACO|nr:uncharacterized protein LOC109719632 [Ananas comosus]